MSTLGTDQRPLRVAIIGSGPSGFYTADTLLKSDKKIFIDIIDRLPTPFGLVRYGVAPDHQKIKNVTKVYEKTAEHPNVTFIGNVTIGKHLTIEDLKSFYDAIVFCSGAEADRNLGVDGEYLRGAHAATEFVAWYNGHPEYKERHFDLSCERAVIIGQGNVALDIARILCKTIEELKTSDITQHALDALAQSKIKEVHIYGRRGPAQAAFTPVEIREFGELADCIPIIDPVELNLNESSQKELLDPQLAPKKKNYEILKSFADLKVENKSKKFYLHFRKSPVQILGQGKVEKVIFEKNELYGEAGNQRSRGTGVKEEINCGIVFRSVGYRGIPIKGLPFHEQSGRIPNKEGRVCDAEHDFIGLYAAGWIKRGPTGIIGTNKPDAEETAKHLLEDIAHLIPCANPDRQAVHEFLKQKGVRTISFADWKKIDAAEIANGQKVGKPREKFVDINDMLAVL